MKKVDLIRDYYGVKFRRNNSETELKQRTQKEYVVEQVNIILSKIKAYDNKISLINVEDIKDERDFFDYVFEIVKKYDKLSIGENRYIYYDREYFWNNSYRNILVKNLIGVPLLLFGIKEKNAIYNCIDQNILI